MRILGMQFRNLGRLGNGSEPVALSRTPLEISAQQVTSDWNDVDQLDVSLFTGPNGYGKTTLMLGLFFVFGGRGIANGRQVPSAIITMGTNEMAVALEMQNTDKVRKASLFGGNGRRRSRAPQQDTITIATTVRKDPAAGGHEYFYYVIDGFHDLNLPFPPGSRLERAEYYELLALFGVNDGVLRVMKETMQQNQLASLCHLSDEELFDMLARISGHDKLRTEFRGHVEAIRQGLARINEAKAALDNKRLALEIAAQRRRIYDEWGHLREQLEPARDDAQKKRAVHCLFGERHYAALARYWEEQRVAISQELSAFDASLQSARLRKAELGRLLADLDQQIRTLLQRLQDHAGVRRVAQDKLGRLQACIERATPDIQAKSAPEWDAEASQLDDQRISVAIQERDASQVLCETQKRIADLSAAPERRLPRYVLEFSQALLEKGVPHTILANVLEIQTEPAWQERIEAELGGLRLKVMVQPGKDFRTAEKQVEMLGYRPGILTPRRRPGRPTGYYHDLVWEVLDLGQYEEEWGGHIDYIGIMFMATDVAEWQAIPESRRTRIDASGNKQMLRALTMTGVVSMANVYAYSNIARERTVLYCGNRSTEIELRTLHLQLPELQERVARLRQSIRDFEAQIGECRRRAEIVRQYDDAIANLPAAKEELEELVRESNRLVDENDDLDASKMALLKEDGQLDQRLAEAQKRREILQNQIGTAENNLEHTKTQSLECSSRHAQLPASFRRRYSSEIEGMVREAWVEDSDPRSLAREGVLKSLDKEAAAEEETVKKIEMEIALLEGQYSPMTRELVAAHETAKKEYQIAQEAIAAADTAHEKAIETAQESYQLLKKEMEIVVGVLREQVEEVGHILNMQARIDLEMDVPELVDVLGDVDRLKMRLVVRVKFRQDAAFFKINDSSLSGGQREMAAISVMCGMLFAAQRLSGTRSRGGPMWVTAPPMVLDEPFRSLDASNLRKAIGSILLMPVQIIVSDPKPDEAWATVFHTVAVVGVGDSGNSTLEVSRDPAAGRRSELALAFLPQLREYAG